MTKIPDKKDSNYFQDKFKLEMFDLIEYYNNKERMKLLYFYYLINILLNFILQFMLRDFSFH